ncbi:hypothetical protein A2331_07070 [Candidatus Falkowbacteria bacterium RIFOXYB2_FULL_34_18]|uniref:Cadherin domain-containing protein n=1 Tax=Candidatus Falkowbacteria bacterium RIFOXYD2_FULL_34_120 TaxID=1798007 RepID=A0A1F5TRF6_9BACT|nr:MAG: hypothetical protein A2331_07070 [Candidatus Falkowbacteria bacterium RIFOXYB2_FULL_34_18]OGF29918.1 MAG: hypothetical protein A2500_03605 [Candidatus Falkowbacteria bacterium RIFOXYC12_FULL_34_55]OGF37224.1 MAG: hypothetical protein A2466_02910 [Candidatus Falkowbacteria bacterium RIFOXYC2_FULL_34_220]OGF39456.1 MAG: hypothetical protein A2515_03980 [Candidatus Falkowbacteria bacterium RIFOXYD12_FULL_34_57]OGF41562.1 MAG: hypothetical protein A2531_02625 [Candidatus Falkowbacteria bact
MKLKTLFKTLILLCCFVFVLFLGFNKPCVNVWAQTSPDAIAVRVVPNPNHYSAKNWYKKQGFTGSPQSIIVDDYEGVREGRTVYVNAANVDDKGTANPADDELFTNIYLISYNQSAENVTRDIFGQMLSHWKFNTNLTIVNTCNKSTNLFCLIDSDCPKSEYCLSQKAKVIRDTRRLADLNSINGLAKKYYETRKSYPRLQAGTYLPGISISAWPSWQKNLAQELGELLPFDPVNKLGPCGSISFNETTCWDEQAKRFADPIPFNNQFDLPADSYVYVYKGEVDGSAYDLCAVMESGLIGASGGACSSSVLTNNPPEFIDYYLPVTYINTPFEGFIKIHDQDGDPLIWRTIPAALPIWGGWTGPIAIEPTATLNHLRVFNDQGSSAIGQFSFTLEIDDSRGGVVSKIFTITMIVAPPKLSFSNLVYEASSTNPLYFNIRVSDNPASFPLTYTLNSGVIPLGLTDPPIFVQAGANYYNFTISGIIDTSVAIPVTTDYQYQATFTNNPGGFVDTGFVITVVNDAPIISPINNVSLIVGYNDLNVNPLYINAIDPQNNHIDYLLINPLPQGLVATKINDRVYRINGVPNGATPINTNYDNIVRATDEYGAESSAPFSIMVRNRKPIMNPVNCVPQIRTGQAFSCTVSATDPDGHAIVNYSFGAGSFPPGFSINAAGLITGPSFAPGNYSGEIVATDQYGAVSDGALFTIRVVSFCGDNITQSPNMEGRGGPLDDGNEICDNPLDVAPNPALSSINRQYECFNNCPQVGNCLNTCIFTGGYCGDGSVQAAHGEQCEAPGNGSSVNNQWACAACRWDGGWCGNAVCDILYEQYDICLADCGWNISYSNFQYCTNEPVAQPGCYAGSPNPRLEWSFSGVQSEFCDCDNTPASDCPLGSPCPPSTQVAYYIQVDNNPNFSSPEIDSGIIVSGNHFHNVVGAALNTNTAYHWRIMIRDNYGVWGRWAKCTGPFTTSPGC